MSNEERLDSLKKVRSSLYGKLKNKQQGGFKDCCEEYKFLRKSNDISFNNKMNELRITHLVLDEKYNQTDVLMRDIITPIKHGANTVFGVTGKTRSGKSELVETIVLILKDVNKKHRGRDVELYLCWTQPQFYLILKKLKKGDIVWRDEDPRSLGTGSRVEKWAVDNILHAIAKMENSFIFVDPKEIKVDICDLYLESAGMNLKTRENRFMIMDDEQRYFGHVYVKLHNDEGFRAWYEREKDKFVAETIEKGGKFKSIQEDIETEQDESKEDLDEIIEVIREIYNPTYKPHEKERNIHIWTLYREQYKDKDIAKIFGVGITTVRRIYEDIESLL